jgi:hypothetical protein
LHRSLKRRGLSRLALGVLVAAVALTALGQALADRRAQAVSSSFFGIYGWSPDRAVERSAARQAGAGLAQIAVDWHLIEFDEAYNNLYFGSSNGFDYSAINPVDQRVRGVAESGFEPILLIVNPPRWATQVDDTQGPLKPEKVAKYADFVRRLAVRYAGSPYGVRKIVLFPEPDHRQSFPGSCTAVSPIHRGWGDQPAQFAAMLRQTYPVVKAAAPSVSLIMGALAYDFFGGPNRPAFNSSVCGPFNYTFLDEVLAAGGASYFDMFAFNSYAVFGIGWEQQPQAGGAFDVAAKATYLRARFPELAAKPTIVLESGVWSDPSVGIQVRTPTGVGAVDPNVDWQAGYPAKLFARALSVGLSGVVWYGLRDYPGDVQRGLLDQSDQPKRSLYGYQQAVLRLTGTDFQSTLAPSATAAGMAEGYVFRTATGGRLVALWAVGDLSASARVTVDMPGGSVRAYDLTGAPVGGLSIDGDQVTLDLTHTPVYLMSGPAQLRNLLPLIPRNVVNP